MSEAVLLALINSAPSIIGAVMSLVTAIGVIVGIVLAWHIKRNTDGMTTKLVESAKVEGLIEGKALEQANPTTPSTPIIDGGRRSTDQ